MQSDFAPLPGDVVIGVLVLKWERVPAKVARTDAKGCYGLEFAALTTEQRRIITEFIYCRAGEWESHGMPERTAVIALPRCS